MRTMEKNQELASAVDELSILLEIAGQSREARSLKGEIATLRSGQLKRLEALTQLNRIRSAIFVIEAAPLPSAERAQAIKLRERVERALKS